MKKIVTTTAIAIVSFTIGYGIFINPLLALAQGLTADEQATLEAQVGNDYFTAQFRTEVRSYLAQVENRHASERVWKLYRAGVYEEPLSDCRYVLARFPNHPGALHLMGEIAIATNRTSLPISYFERALRLYPQHAFTYAEYGHYLVEINAVSAGIAELREALRLDPEQLQAQAWLAEALPLAVGKGQGAARDSTKADSTQTDAAHPSGSPQN